MSAKADRARLSIMRALSDSTKPIGASQVAAFLLAEGIDLQPRTIRHYLMQLDEEGYTELVSRRMGRVITDRGREELLLAGVASAGIGLVSSRVDTLAYRMSMNSTSGEGSVIVNVSLVDPVDVGRVAREIQLVAGQGYVMGNRFVVADAGEDIAGMRVPDGFVAIGTVCSLSLNGILQKEGVPVISRFGGLLEIKERRLTRFVNMIDYSGSTLDPLEIFLRADMTSVRDVVLRGSGIICASFREVPSAAVGHVQSILARLKKHKLGGVLAIGRPNQSLFGINVSEGHCGMVVAGGLNAVAAAKELGIRLTFCSMAGLKDYDTFKSAREVLRLTR